MLLKIKHTTSAGCIAFDVRFGPTIHDRFIATDTGRKTVLGSGIDIFQFVTGDAFDLATRVQQFRQVGITYIHNPVGVVS